MDSVIAGNYDFNSGYWSSECDDNGIVRELKKEFVEDRLPRYFKAMTKRLEENKGNEFIVGKTFTIADASCA